MNISPLTVILWTSAWTAIGWLACDRLAIGRDACSKRARYRSFIELLRKKTEARIANYFVEEHRYTFADFDREALDVRPHIRDRGAFDRLCTDYKIMSFDALDEMKNEAARAKLLAILDQLLNYAK